MNFPLHKELLNKIFLGPFGPVRPSGLDFQARPGPRAARPVTISNPDIRKLGVTKTKSQANFTTIFQRAQYWCNKTAKTHGIIYCTRTSSSAKGCSLKHFPLAHLPRLAAYIRRRFSRFLFFRSFARFFTRISLSLRFAQINSASLALLASALPLPRPRLCSPRASPSASSLLVPRLSSLPGSTPLFSSISGGWRSLNGH